MNPQIPKIYSAELYTIKELIAKNIIYLSSGTYGNILEYRDKKNNLNIVSGMLENFGKKNRFVISGISGKAFGDSNEIRMRCYNGPSYKYNPSWFKTSKVIRVGF